MRFYLLFENIFSTCNVCSCIFECIFSTYNVYSCKNSCLISLCVMCTAARVMCIRILYVNVYVHVYIDALLRVIQM